MISLSTSGPGPSRQDDREDAGTSFEAALKRQDAAGLLRTERAVEKSAARRVVLADGRLAVDFSSNSYLGLQETVRTRTIRRFLNEHHLTSASSSRVVSGARAMHHRLEGDLARFLRTPSAAVFGSGYLCCAGVIATLAGSRDLLIHDERIHASLRAGMSMSKAKSCSYAHADPADLRRVLKSCRVAGRIFIVTDGLFSMDGDFAPLPELAGIAARHGAWLIVDDAHGIAAVGPGGRGSFEKFGLVPSGRHILIGTLSKTFASYGGFVAASAAVIRYIKARSREFIYTTAAPAFQIIAAQEALSIVKSSRGAALRRRLASNMKRLGKGLGRTIVSPIVSIPVPGGPAGVLAAARSLQDQGCYAVGMRYPTVPRGREMIRISLSAAHTEQDIRHLVRAIHSLRAGS